MRGILYLNGPSLISWSPARQESLASKRRRFQNLGIFVTFLLWPLHSRSLWDAKWNNRIHSRSQNLGQKNCRMRFNFDFSEANTGSRRSLTPKEELDWEPLENHPIFSAADGDLSTGKESSRAPRNIVAWDGASRLYYWNSKKCCLHRISIRLGEPEPTSVLAASPSKVLLYS